MLRYVVGNTDEWTASYHIKPTYEISSREKYKNREHFECAKYTAKMAEDSQVRIEDLSNTEVKYLSFSIPSVYSWIKNLGSYSQYLYVF